MTSLLRFYKAVSLPGGMNALFADVYHQAGSPLVRTLGGVVLRFALTSGRLLSDAFFGWLFPGDEVLHVLAVALLEILLHYHSITIVF